MRIILTAVAAVALTACERAADTTTNAADNMTMDVNATDANAMEANAMVTPAAIQLNETTWEFTMDGKPVTETIDAAGNYVAWSGTEHVDHGTALVKDGKACFTSAMDKEGESCWTGKHVEIGQSMEGTSDKGEKMTIKRVAYVPAPESQKR